jgi:hypothetical protein
MAALLDRGFEGIGVGAIVAARHEPPASAAPTAVAEVDQPSKEKPGLLGKAAARLAAHLAPIGKAEAAPMGREQRPAPAGERWGLQLGAFRTEGAAAKAAREAASLAVSRGKPMQIVEPAKADRERLYRARLLNFTPQEAWSACIALHKKNIECTVVPPPALRVANR